MSAGYHVIASEATRLRLLRKLRRAESPPKLGERRRKQSIVRRAEAWIASSLALLAMTVETAQPPRNDGGETSPPARRRHQHLVALAGAGDELSPPSLRGG